MKRPRRRRDFRRGRPGGLPADVPREAPRDDARGQMPAASVASCIFCRIADETAPAFVVWEDDEFIAFLDAMPITAGHVLIVPRRHVRTVWELDEAAYARLFARARALAGPVARAAKAPWAGVAVEGFGVAHAHVHLVPVRKGGDLDPSKQARATPAELAQAADRLREALADDGDAV